MTSNLKRQRILRFGLALSFSLMGCTITPIQNEFGQQNHRRTTDGEHIVFHRGQPGPMVNRLAKMADAPTRMIPFGHKPTRHEISAETEQKITAYLEKNGLNDVYVCVNEYDPAGEWKRLKANRRISPVWRYSIGALSLAGYTLFPEPVVCANQYNAFTNRLSVNLDEPIEILYAAASAKDISAQSLPGTYAVITSLPGISTIPRIRATNDVTTFAREEGDWDTEVAVYRHLYPRIGMEGTALAVLVSPLWWEIPLIGLGGSGVGHLAGRYVESQRKLELAAANDRSDRDSNLSLGEQQADPEDSEAYVQNVTSDRNHIRQFSGP